MLWDSLEGGMGWVVAGRFGREGICECLRLIHADVWQKPTQLWTAIILQFKINKEKWGRIL